MKQSNGSIKGIGVTITPKDNKVTIVSTIKDSPADRAGLVENDVIEKINDVDISGDDMEKAVSMIAEANNSEIKLTIKRADTDEFDVKVVPEEVKIKSVEGAMLNSSYRIYSYKNFYE